MMAVWQWLTARSRTTSPSTVWCAAVLIPLFLLTQVYTTSPLPEAQRWLSPYKASPVVRCTTARQQLPTLTLITVLVQWLEVWRCSSVLWHLHFLNLHICLTLVCLYVCIDVLMYMGSFPQKGIQLFSRFQILEVWNVLYTLIVTHWESEYLSWSCKALNC